MPELSTLLRQRLRATEDRDPQHPDPDTLNAYIEELLPASERQGVLQHLSMCGECREVVSLAMPETAAAAGAAQGSGVPATSESPRRRWFTSPAFGLAGSLAATILGVALILRLSPSSQNNEARRVEQSAQQASTNAAASAAKENTPAHNQAAEASQEPSTATSQQPAAASSSPVQAPSTAATMAAVSPARSRLAYSPTQRELKPGPTESKVPVVVADLRRDYINKTFLANSYETQVPTLYRDLPQAPAPAQANMPFAPPAVVAGNSVQSSSAFQIPSNSAGANRGVLTFYSRETMNGRSSTLIGKIVDLGKRPLGRRIGPPIPSSSLGNRAMFQPGMPVGQAGDALAARPAAGVEGSLAESQAFSSRALGASASKAVLGGTQYQWKVVQGKLLKSSDLSHWTEENPGGENLKFSIVSSNGSEIWAGGSDASLVHSHDGGATWERVTLGAAATGTITSIEVAGQNLLVKSSSGQSWSSQDGGKSWDLE